MNSGVCQESVVEHACFNFFNSCSVFPSFSPFFPPSNSPCSPSLLKLFFIILIFHYWLYRVLLVFHIYGGDHMILDNLPGGSSLQKTDSPFLGSYKKSYKQLAWSPAIFTTVLLTHQLALISLGSCLMGTVSLSYIDNTISEQMFWTSGSSNLSEPSSATFPDP